MATSVGYRQTGERARAVIKIADLTHLWLLSNGREQTSVAADNVRHLLDIGGGTTTILRQGLGEGFHAKGHTRLHFSLALEMLPFQRCRHRVRPQRREERNCPTLGIVLPTILGTVKVCLWMPSRDAPFLGSSEERLAAVCLLEPSCAQSLIPR